MSASDKNSTSMKEKSSLNSSVKKDASGAGEAHKDPAVKTEESPFDYSTLGLPNLLVKVPYEKAKVDMRVQDYWGRTGTIRWIGKLEKKHKPPNKEVGHYVGLEYDEPSENTLRCDGTWEGKTYFTCEPKKGLLLKPQDLYEEVNQKGIDILRDYFKERVESWHDFELVKFCIARNFEMNKVVEMLDKHLKWRESFKPDPEEYFDQTIPEFYPAGYSGTVDFDENLIYCERPTNGGKCHPSDFVKRYTLPVIARWHAAGMEMGIRRMRESNYAYKRVCYIVDLLNVKALTRPMIDFGQTLASIEQDNYPENLGRVFIVNCPAFFRWAWKLIKIFIDARTNKKINFQAPNHAVNTMKLVMKEEDIPSFCGGKSTKWTETNNSMLGSSDPSKAFKGEMNMENIPNLKEVEEEIIEGDGEMGEISEGDFPSETVDTHSENVSTTGSPVGKNNASSSTASPVAPEEKKSK